MLGRMWRNWNPGALSVGLSNGAAAMENGMAISQKLKIELQVPCDPAILSEDVHKEWKADTRTPTFIAVLFTVVPKWQQPKCPLTHEWKKKIR